MEPFEKLYNHQKELADKYFEALCEISRISDRSCSNEMGGFSNLKLEGHFADMKRIAKQALK